MRIGRGGHDNDIDIGVLDQILGAAVGFDTRMILGSVMIGFGMSLDDGGEGEIGDLEDERDVESVGTGAVADYADFEGHVK